MRDCVHPLATGLHAATLWLLLTAAACFPVSQTMNFLGPSLWLYEKIVHEKQDGEMASMVIRTHGDSIHVVSSSIEGQFYGPLNITLRCVQFPMNPNVNCIASMLYNYMIGGQLNNLIHFAVKQQQCLCHL